MKTVKKFNMVCNGSIIYKDQGSIKLEGRTGQSILASWSWRRYKGDRCIFFLCFVVVRSFRSFAFLQGGITICCFLHGIALPVASILYFFPPPNIEEKIPNLVFLSGKPQKIF